MGTNGKSVGKTEKFCSLTTRIALKGLFPAALLVIEAMP